MYKKPKERYDIKVHVSEQDFDSVILSFALFDWIIHLLFVTKITICSKRFKTTNWNSSMLLIMLSQNTPIIEDL